MVNIVELCSLERVLHLPTRIGDQFDFLFGWPVTNIVKRKSFFVLEHFQSGRFKIIVPSNYYNRLQLYITRKLDIEQ